MSSEQISNNEQNSQATSSDSEADNASKSRFKSKSPSEEISDWERLRQQQQNFTHFAYQDSSSSGDTIQLEEKIAIDYMAKDYSSFRAALLDLIPRKIPQWKDKSEADMGIMLIELFSYIADELSYFQDRVANEAFLRTARARSSVSNHLSLIDYHLQNGLSADAFIKVTVNGSSAIIPAGFQISTYPERGVGEGGRFEREESAGAIIFETVEDQLVDVRYNEIKVKEIDKKNNENNHIDNSNTRYLSAKLLKRLPELKKGRHILLFQRDIRTKIITKQAIVKLAQDSEIINEEGSNITYITWEKRNEYPEVEFRPGEEVLCCVNILRASHGRTIHSEILKDKDQEVSKFTFTLMEAPLTFISEPSSSSPTEPHSALKVWVDGEPWEETDSLLKCGPFDRKFAISVDEEGYATIFFGDGKFGSKPEDDSLIEAEYRVGSGTVGNVGKNTLTQFKNNNNSPQNSYVSVQEIIESVTNPLPATSGRDIEPIEDAKIAGPKSLKELERAVTLKDYEDLVKREFQNEITNARARFVYTGSWDTIFVSVDLKGQVQRDSVEQYELFDRIRKYLDRVKMIGFEVQVEEAKYVPIEIGIAVYIRKYFDSEVLRARIRSSLSYKDNDSIADGSTGLFHPDNFTFGDPVYASKIYEVLKNTPEVKYGIITTFRKKQAGEAENGRNDISKSSSSSTPPPFSPPDAMIAQRDEETKRNLELGYIPINKNEIITIDDDPLHPENGTIILNFIEDNESKQERAEEDHDFDYSLWDDHNSVG